MRRSLNIVFVCNHFLPRVGGVELSVHHTALALTSAGHTVTIVTETPDEVSRALQPYTVLRFSVPRRWPITRLWYWHKMWEYREVFRCADIIHFHDYIPLVHWFLPLRAIVNGPVYALTAHGFEGTNVKLRHQVFRLVASWMVDIVFGVGEYLNDMYIHRFDYFFVGAAVRVGTNTAAAEPSRNKFTFIGRLEFDTQIVICTRLLHEYSNTTEQPIRLQLIGSGSETTRLRSYTSDSFDIEHTEATLNVETAMLESTCIIATGFLAILDGFSNMIPVLIPAFTELKQKYVASIPYVDSFAFVARSETEFIDHVESILLGRPIVQEKIVAAKAYANSLTWSSIARLHETAYLRHVNSTGQPEESPVREEVVS